MSDGNCFIQNPMDVDLPNWTRAIEMNPYALFDSGSLSGLGISRLG